MTDPVMRELLLECCSNPAALPAQMKDPEVAAKMQKLVDGMIQFQ
jgi:hypothetical protein